ncbi:hypothetical protein HOG48_05845 [Candidatus Peregrinibacteria bacterium]|mgnify:CR=1 FL=1|jgi:hypothetical protein|nr:hypothetical protein [Candidatus Peregrinibacteria bacterium]
MRNTGNLQMISDKEIGKYFDKDFKNYSDRKLMALAKKYGTQTLLWRQRFIGLLPEVNSRCLYEKKGYSSIFEFGKRMAGLSEKQIGLAINLEKRFEDKPALYEALTKGEISINKLTRIASIATKENEGILTESAKRLSNRALEVLVKDVRTSKGLEFENQNGLFEPKIEVKSLHVQSEVKEGNDKGGNANLNTLIELGLSGGVIEKLKVLKDKDLDVNDIILELLEKREKELEERKLRHREKVVECELKRKIEGKKPTRYIAAETRKILKEEYGAKCSVSGCMRDADCVHHTVRFALTKSNNPCFLAPLCSAHHEIAHLVDEKVAERRLY